MKHSSSSKLRLLGTNPCQYPSMPGKYFPPFTEIDGNQRRPRVDGVVVLHRRSKRFMNVSHKPKCVARRRRGFSESPSMLADFPAREMAPSIDFPNRQSQCAQMEGLEIFARCLLHGSSTWLFYSFSTSPASLNNLMLVPTSLAYHRIGIGALAPISW